MLMHNLLRCCSLRIRRAEIDCICGGVGLPLAQPFGEKSRRGAGITRPPSIAAATRTRFSASSSRPGLRCRGPYFRIYKLRGGQSDWMPYSTHTTVLTLDAMALTAVPKTTRVWKLKRAPVAAIAADTFELVTEDLPELEEGQIIVQTVYLSNGLNDSRIVSHCLLLIRRHPRSFTTSIYPSGHLRRSALHQTRARRRHCGQ